MTYDKQKLTALLAPMREHLGDMDTRIGRAESELGELKAVRNRLAAAVRALDPPPPKEAQQPTKKKPTQGAAMVVSEAALAEMTAASFLRVGGEGEGYLRDPAAGYLVRERTRYDDGSAQLAWNAVLAWGPAPTYLLVQWQMSGDDVLALAPAATGLREVEAQEAPEPQPAWIAALGAALASRDAAALIDLSAREGWRCRLRGPDKAPQACPAAAGADSR